MLNHLKSEANIAYTENGAVTNASTMSDCLDLFAVIGALRAADDQEIIRRFVRAYAEDADIAMKILFFGPMFAVALVSAGCSRYHQLACREQSGVLAQEH